MDDLAAMLGELLKSPGAMDKLKGLASGLLGGAAAEPAAGGDAPPPEPPDGGSPLGIDADALQMMTKIAPLLSSFRQEDDSTRFLHALRPLLSEERQKKLDEATKLLQLMRLLPLFKSSGIF
ncbi:hypothetical protein [Clostridium sp. KNHs216]|jgi:hypothetical protein|uniref:hypothetical protein n=1 Tax=Clostridium sp. KNHs216 TaxID=1550235 RepID=UPI000691E264|nr:hypothetical protein [Clostridium sp. KNHs216]MBE6823623.1 hypothetical protein [Oscillospiraceae bacterium]TQI67564.1 hypothetical protein LY85_2256 [Clostridium sp. KNHs216]